MLVQLGNHAPVHGPQDTKTVTTIDIPEYDALWLEKNDHPYAHAVGGFTVQQFKDHLADAISYNGGITNLPGSACVQAINAAWPTRGGGRPAWVKVTEAAGLTAPGIAADLEAWLSSFYDCPTLSGFYGGCDDIDAEIHKETDYWTKNGIPGEYLAGVPGDILSIQNIYTVDGRIMNNNNDGGDSLTAMGQVTGTGTGASATQITGCSGLTSNGLAGHRVYAYTTSGNAFVWGNVVSNATTSITVDQWYAPATPGGSAGTTPGSPYAYIAVDGGMISTWFAAIGTGGSGWANTNHALATAGSTEYYEAGGGLNRKQCPAATDVSASARTVTLVPVFTANGSDTLPDTFTVVGFFASMVSTFSQAGGPMKFIDAISPTATLSNSGDALTITEVVSGS